MLKSIHRVSAEIKRSLSLYEHEAFDILESRSISTPRRILIADRDEVQSRLSELGNEKFVVKAQVLTGGRGKGTFESGLKGGVKVVEEPSSVPDIIKQMINQRLFTKQTGTQGIICQKVLVTEYIPHKRELYCCVTLDRASKGPVLILSKNGGVDIERVPKNEIFTIHLSKETDINTTNLNEFLKDENNDVQESILNFAKSLFRAFRDLDATMIEINPFTILNSKIVCLDTKISLDDNAFFRHEKIFKSHDYGGSTFSENEARKYDINYIKLDGNIGCLVNGAGLAMATMDLLKLKGGRPANFLDIGGGATARQVAKAIELIGNDQNVRTLYINIFGGIMRCDVIAEGIINAVKKFQRSIPMVIRLKGNNLDLAKQKLENSGLNYKFIDDFEKSAEEVVGLCVKSSS